MSLKTTPPIDGFVASAAQWGLAVFQDLTAISNIGVMVNVAPPGIYTNATTSYTSVTGWALSYNKTSNTSRLLVIPILTGWQNSVAVQTWWAIQVDGVDYPAAYYNWNAASDHRQVVGAVVIPSLSSGTKTLQIRARDNSTGTLTHDTQDRASLIVFEMP